MKKNKLNTSGVLPNLHDNSHLREEYIKKQNKLARRAITFTVLVVVLGIIGWIVWINIR